jgi:hypothetical protein
MWRLGLGLPLHEIFSASAADANHFDQRPHSATIVVASPVARGWVRGAPIVDHPEVLADFKRVRLLG